LNSRRSIREPDLVSNCDSSPVLRRADSWFFSCDRQHALDAQGEQAAVVQVQDRVQRRQRFGADGDQCLARTASSMPA
jgi:hypothetical protein